ncbi:hypothetical protein [Neoactinobaculum massilliense]|uniref:primosomal protein N' family DNA-binding protein n=1 Tax=Neoactinobaculum massilliense TaxID=2364794 RepID=UPI000F543B00|nr:hypothetical protein [Neoactinobaculum massilliense]
MNRIEGLGEIPELGEQGALLPVPESSLPVRASVPEPVAHVQVMLAQPHLDHIFDFLIPEKYAEVAQPGVRVEVMVGPRKTNGFIVARDSVTHSAAKLRPLRRVVSAEPALARSTWELAQEVSRRWACSIPDVLRLAVPARHARAEKMVTEAAAHATPEESVERAAAAGKGDALEYEAFASYRGGLAYLEAVAEGRHPRGVLAALPGTLGTRALVREAVQTARAAGRGVIVIVPTTREARSFASLLGDDRGEPVALMVSESSAEERYGTYLRVLRGTRHIVVGTRSAMWAPVANLGLAIVIDDAVPLLREVRAPYAHARDVLDLRARREGAAFLVVAPYVSEEAAQLVTEGAVLIDANEPARRAALPRVSTPDQWRGGMRDVHRLPSAAFTIIRGGLQRGPVLVTVPRSGYLPLMACATCGREARCSQCGGELAISRHGEAPRCTRCGAVERMFRCPNCQGGRIRAVRVGSQRTGEEVARAFPGVGVVISSAGGADGITAGVDATPRIVVATPGAEPLAEGGYAASVILDAQLLAGRGLDGETEQVRKIARVVARTRDARHGGQVLIAGSVPATVVRALATWSHGERAAASLRDRASLRLPPVATWVGVSGARADVRAYLGVLRQELRSQQGDVSRDATGTEPAGPVDALLAGGIHMIAAGVEVLGPVPAPREGEVTMQLRTEHSDALRLTRAARRAYREYAGTGMGDPLRIERDPPM